MKKTNVLVILDGFAESAQTEGNAIAQSGTPYLRSLTARYPHTLLSASGAAVGLPEGFMGNSEVGHTNIGAGRVVYQSLALIDNAIKEGRFQTNPAFLTAIKHAREGGKAVHLMGLLSDGGVHSHIEHLFALLRLCKAEGVKEVYVHVFTDGRDAPPDSAGRYVGQLQEFIAREKVGKIATIVGRYYAMDRDNRWERVEQAYRLLTAGAGEAFPTAEAALAALRARGLTDEFFTPARLNGGEPIRAGDSVIFFNFRADRAREITRALTDPDFTAFDRGFAASDPPRPDLTYVCMTNYDDKLQNLSVAYPPQNLSNTLGEYLSKKGLRQLRIAETEKYAHVTFFLNAGAEQPFDGEDRILIGSPKVATYDLKPEMSAHEITACALSEIRRGAYDAVILNYSNCDMVGHTGVFEAAVKAAGVVDRCLQKVVGAVRRAGGAAIVTADHGNAEKMRDERGLPFTAHTLNKVPFILVSDRHIGARLREGGALCDIAPTFLELLDLTPPPEMTGKSLIEK